MPAWPAKPDDNRHCDGDGQVTTTADYRVDDIVREVVCDIGYDRAKYGFDGHTCAVLTAMHGQRRIFAIGVDDALERSAVIGRRYGHQRRQSGHDVRLRLR